MLKILLSLHQLMSQKVNILKDCTKKIFVLLLVSSSIAAFATLGDGSKKTTNKSSLLSLKTSNQKYKSFSLRSGYNFRGNHILDAPKGGTFILLNTTVTYQKGNTTYILPMKKKVLLDKITFAPTQKH
ncbi:MAG TPA: hypothetical protein VM888_12695 [Chitinophagaceae bacterium]|nr:hypothetical protein [Chitinophagaceae bacterium]